MNRHPPTTRRRAAAHSAFGFSLMELLIVIAIIGLLVGLATVVGVKIKQRAEISRTRVVLQQAMGVETELRVQRGGFLLHNNAPAQFDQFKDIEYFVKTAREQSDVTRTMIDSCHLLNTDDDGPDTINGEELARDEIADAWDNPLKYRENTSGPTTDDLPRHATPFFASAGPDGQWGEVDPDTNEPDEPAKDNLYSFDMD